MNTKWLGGTLLVAALFASQAPAAPAIYVMGGPNGKMLTNNDANNYFNVSGVLGPKGYPSAVGHVGLQFDRYFALEASIDSGLERINDMTYYNFGAPTRRIVTNWKMVTYSVTPGLTWASRNSVNMLGFRIGQANLSGHVQDDAFGATGSYDQSAQTTDYGAIFRTSVLMADHFSLGLEFGYDWTVFKNIANRNDSGSYDPVHTPERNVSTVGHNGDPTELDFSGGHVAIVLGLWTGPVVRDDGVAEERVDE